MVGDSINTTHLWSFGDGNFSINIASPTNIYLAAGTYNIGHSITRHVNGVSCSDTINKQIIIQSVPCNLQAYFIWHADSINWNTIHFENKSTPYEAGDSIRWTFGDNSPPINGLAGSLSFPTHVYPNAGTYNVCIRVKKKASLSSAPCVSEICKTVVVTTPCNFVANFSVQPDPNHPLRIKFTNLSAPINNSDSVRWTFGDGTSVNGLQSDPNVANPTHDYTQGGAYTVCLRVKKNGNATGTAPCVRESCKTVTVESPCNIQVHFSMHRDSLNPRKVYFTNLTVTPSTNALTKWSFGDGTFAGTWNAVHEYTQAGSYRVCLTVQLSPNCIRESCDTVVIPPPPPTCQDISKFKFEKFSNDNQKYKFIPDYIANDIVYTWTFGDGTGSHDPIAVHRYAQAGVYIACLTAWRGPNCASTTCKEIRVLPQINCDSIHVSYTYQRDPFIPNKIYFYANANFPVLDQTWTITRLSPATTPPVILHQNNPVYVFHDTGYYRVCLKAITLGGCVKEYCSVIRIEHVVSNVCELQAFPNPASNLVNVNVTLTQSGMIDAYVYNSTNILVREKHQQGLTGNNVVTINVNDLAPGLYTMKVQYNGKVCYARFTKL
jgi:PKD repeat protein